MTDRVLDLSYSDGAAELTQGLAVLAQEIRQSTPAQRRRPSVGDGLTALFDAELRLALEAGDADRAYEAAAALTGRTGSSAGAHAAVSRVLQSIGAAWAAGDSTVAHEHRVTSAAAAVVIRLRLLTTTPPGRPTVVLAVPPGDQHVLGLQGLAQQLAEAGHACDVVGELPVHELAGLARSATAVVLSVHVAGRGLTATVAAVRAAAPEVLIVLGGPAARRSAGADLVTQDVPALVAALDARRSPFSEREREVLQCVADGLSNQEAGEQLGVTSGTVKSHLDHIFAKSGATGRAAAVAIGLRAGWIR